MSCHSKGSRDLTKLAIPSQVTKLTLISYSRVIGEQEYDVDVEIFDLNGHLIGVGHVSERIKVGNLAVKGIKDFERRTVKRKKI